MAHFAERSLKDQPSYPIAVRWRTSGAEILIFLNLGIVFRRGLLLNLKQTFKESRFGDVAARETKLVRFLLNSSKRASSGVAESGCK